MRIRGDTQLETIHRFSQPLPKQGESFGWLVGDKIRDIAGWCQPTHLIGVGRYAQLNLRASACRERVNQQIVRRLQGHVSGFADA